MKIIVNMILVQVNAATRYYKFLFVKFQLEYVFILLRFLLGLQKHVKLYVCTVYVVAIIEAYLGSKTQLINIYIVAIVYSHLNSVCCIYISIVYSKHIANFSYKLCIHIHAVYSVAE